MGDLNFFWPNQAFSLLPSNSPSFSMREFIFLVKKSEDFVYRSLTDAASFTSFHPLIYRMEPTGNNQYTVYEQIRFGPITYRFTYPATVHGTGTEVRMEAVVKKLTRVTMVFSLKEENGLTRVTERISIQSVLPLKRFLYRLFERQHRVMFENMGA